MHEEQQRRHFIRMYGRYGKIDHFKYLELTSGFLQIAHINRKCKLIGLTLDIESFALFDKDKGEDSVRPKAEIIRQESFPEREKTFMFYYTGEHIKNAFIFWLTINKLNKNR